MIKRLFIIFIQAMIIHFIYVPLFEKNIVLFSVSMVVNTALIIFYLVTDRSDKDFNLELGKNRK